MKTLTIRTITLQELEQILLETEYIKPGETLHGIDTRGFSYSRADPERLVIKMGEWERVDT